LITVLSILGAFVVLSVLVFIHEFGHFLAGRLLGFTVLEFALGMGPTVLKKEKNGILYALRLFPIGGFCRFYEEEEDAPANARPFNEEKVWKRMLVILAGPFMNFVLAILLAAITLLSYGDYMPEILNFSREDSPAELAGMEVGDILYSIDGYDISYYAEATDAIVAADGESSDLVVLRNGKKVRLTVKDFYDEAAGRNYLGVTISPIRMRFGFVDSFRYSLAYVWSLVEYMFDWLGSIFTTGVQQGDVVGPVGTISIIGQAVRQGMETVLRMGVLLSINLAVINILPFPSLDGGRFVFMCLEAIRGKSLKPQTEGTIHMLGFALLMLLILFLTYQDIMGLIR